MRLRWVIVAGVVVVIAGFAAASLSLNRIIAANRERVLTAAEEAVGRKVRVEEIDASVWGRPGVRLTGVRIADDPQFGTDDFVTADALTVRVKLLPLLQRRIEVARIEL